MAYTLIYTVLLIAILSYLFKMKHKRKTHQMKLKLPPGSMGWPYVGETPQLYSQDPSLFFATKEKRFEIISFSVSFKRSLRSSDMINAIVGTERYSRPTFWAALV